MGERPTLPNLSDEASILAWWEAPGDMDDAKGPAAAIARAMRMKAVWEEHCYKIKDMCEQRQQYRAANSQTITRAIRALCYAMERAQEGSNAHS